MFTSTHNFELSGIKFRNLKALGATSKVGVGESGSSFIIDVTYKEGGGSTTWLCVSAVEYRRNNPTKVGYKVISDKEVVFYDDYGTSSKVFKAGKIFIRKLIREFKKYEIPEIK